MAEADLGRFLEKVRQLNAFVALCEQRPDVREALVACDHHHQVVALARAWGFEIGRRWGDPAGYGAAANLLDSPCPPPGEERVTVLLHTPHLRLERIHSCAAASAPGFWYEQQEHEWVTLLQGAATLRFEEEERPLDLSRGQSLFIPAGRRHRLEATDPAPGSVWLALFWWEYGAG